MIWPLALVKFITCNSNFDWKTNVADRSYQLNPDTAAPAGAEKLPLAAELAAARKKAERMLGSHSRLNKLLRQATARMKKRRSRLQNILNELELLIRMVRAYAEGTYRRVPRKPILGMVAAIIYFVNPFDIIPDFITGLGFLDDATVIGLVIKSFKDEIDLFKSYLTSQTGIPLEEALPRHDES